MLSFNGVEIAKGQTVAILKTPVLKDTSQFGNKGDYEYTYKRYPQQVVVIA